MSTTASYSATARATRAMSARTAGRSSNHTDSRAGQDMNVRVWLSHSAPNLRPDAFAPLAEDEDAEEPGSSPGPQAAAPRASAPRPAKERRALRRDMGVGALRTPEFG